MGMFVHILSSRLIMNYDRELERLREAAENRGREQAVTHCDVCGCPIVSLEDFYLIDSVTYCEDCIQEFIEDHKKYLL